jgi:hypothetical protein
VKRSTALLAIAALFCVGVLVGILGTNLFYLHEIRQPGGLARLGTRWLARSLDRRLDLSAEQRRQVDAILADAAHEAAALRRAFTPPMLEILERARRRIAAVLNPEQREKFERFRRDHAPRIRRMIGGP